MPQPNKNKICVRALEQIGPDLRYPGFYSSLRHVKHRRQEQIAKLMFMSADYSLSFMQLLIAASKRSDFVKRKIRTRGISRHQQTAIEETFRPLEEAFRRSAASYSDDAYAAVVTTAYLRRVLRNVRIASYLNAVYPEIFEELKAEGMTEQSHPQGRSGGKCDFPTAR